MVPSVGLGSAAIMVSVEKNIKNKKGQCWGRTLLVAVFCGEIPTCQRSRFLVRPSGRPCTWNARGCCETPRIRERERSESTLLLGLLLESRGQPALVICAAWAGSAPRMECSATSSTAGHLNRVQQRSRVSE